MATVTTTSAVLNLTPHSDVLVINQGPAAVVLTCRGRSETVPAASERNIRTRGSAVTARTTSGTSTVLVQPRQRERGVDGGSW